eukprot:1190052-Prorocentrum_minimum.AAC.2
MALTWCSHAGMFDELWLFEGRLEDLGLHEPMGGLRMDEPYVVIRPRALGATNADVKDHIMRRHR